MFPAQVSHLLGIRNVRAKPLRLSEAEQILTPTPQVHPTDTSASTHRVIKIEGTALFYMYFYILRGVCFYKNY